MTLCRCGEPNDRYPLTRCSACAEYRRIVDREGEHSRDALGLAITALGAGARS